MHQSLRDSSILWLQEWNDILGELTQHDDAVDAHDAHNAVDHTDDADGIVHDADDAFHNAEGADEANVKVAVQESRCWEHM